MKKVIFYSIILMILGSRAFSMDYTIDYDIRSYFSYNYENKDYILYDEDNEWNDYASFLTASISFSGGGFGLSRFGIGLVLNTSFNTDNTESGSPVSFNQLYFRIPINTFLFLTVGKIKQEFGEAVFTNFSNRLSPKYFIRNNVTRTAPGLVMLDWIAADFLSLGVFSWFPDIKKWKDTDIGMDASLNLDIFSVSFHGFLEKLKYPYLGIDSSLTFDYFKIYVESIIKGKSDQYYFSKDETTGYIAEQTKDKIFYNIAGGIAVSVNIFNFGIEYWYRSEGVTDNNDSAFKDAVKENPANLSYYSPDNYGKYYIGLLFNCSKVFIDNLSFSIKTSYSFLEKTGGSMSSYFDYIFNDNAAFEIKLIYLYGDKLSEYVSYNNYRYSIYSGILFNF